MENVRLDESQTRINIANININNLRSTWYHSSCRKWGETKEILMRAKEESEKAGLKLSIQKLKIMASSPIISWQIEVGKVEAVTNFLFLDCKIIADGSCSHEIERCFLCWRKAKTNLDIILKSGDITADKGLYSQS